MLTDEQMIDRLRSDMERNGLNQSDLARKFDVGRMYISKVLRGEKPLSARIGAALGYEPVRMWRKVRKTEKGRN